MIPIQGPEMSLWKLYPRSGAVTNLPIRAIIHASAALHPARASKQQHQTLFSTLRAASLPRTRLNPGFIINPMPSCHEHTASTSTGARLLFHVGSRMHCICVKPEKHSGYRPGGPASEASCMLHKCWSDVCESAHEAWLRRQFAGRVSLDAAGGYVHHG